MVERLAPRKMNHVQLMRPGKRSRKRMCGCTDYDHQVRAGSLYVQLVERTGEKTVKCYQCVYEAIGFVPDNIGMTYEICGICGRYFKVIWFRAFGMTNMQKYVCFDCFKKMRRAGAETGDTGQEVRA